MTKTPLTIGILTIPGRLSLLEKLAESLSTAVDCYEGPVEVLVAGEEVDSAVSMLDEVLGCPVSHIETDGTAPLGRHRLIEAAETEWLLFLDDDCRVDESLLVAYNDAIQSVAEDVAAIYGPLIFEGRRSTAFEAYRFTPFVHPLQIAKWKNNVEWAPTANAAFSVPDVQAVGNFDVENPVAVSGEDVDVGLRLNAAGHNLVTAPEAEVYHSTESWNDLVGNIQRVYTYGLSEAWLVQRYPERTESLLCSVADGIIGGLVMIGILSSMVTLLTIPLLCLAWVLGLLLRKIKTDPTTPLVAYVLADVYRIVNYLGYARGTVRVNGTIRNLTRRFIFYRHNYVHPRIKKKGVWYQANDQEDDSPPE